MPFGASVALTERALAVAPDEQKPTMKRQPTRFNRQ